jgi:CheY-like chemotaxis protein
MPHGGTIRVSAENVALQDTPGALLPAGRYLKIAITDAGCGIDDDLITKIFDPYFTTKPNGSGLGLAISYSIVKKHGGLLHLENSSPAGSTFSFYLPAANGKTVILEPGSSDAPVSFDRQRILVMDDDDSVRELTSELLGTLGFQVTAVPDGAAALKTYEGALQSGENFHAVILDATIRGGMGGVATIEHLRKVDPGVTAIICSGYSNESALSEFMTYGFRGALPKPFTRHELANVLQRAFEAGKTGKST